ncbi:MAG: transcription-repair coupling factor [Gammaproteobacteria bacterium]|nr:transcription-repair coupling factor [Gammaproteobacteria bacterium]
MVSFSNLKLPQESTDKANWCNLYGCARALACAHVGAGNNAPTVIITPDSLMAYQLEAELSFFLDKKIPILNFCDLETLPYDTLSPHRDIISQRIKILNQLPELSCGILIVSIKTLFQRLAPSSFFSGSGLAISTRQHIDMDPFRKNLEQKGYFAASQVMEHGEFAIRGSIIDLFPMGAKQPFRIDLFDNEVDSIRTFDPETQRSIQKINEINLLPAYEFSFSDGSIELFRENFRKHFDVNPMNCPIYQDTIEKRYTPGIEYYLPLFFEETASIFDYLSKDSLIIQFEKIFQQAETFWQEINHRYDQLSHDITRPILAPRQIFFTVDEIFGKIKPFGGIKIAESQEKTGYDFKTASLPHLNVNHHAKKPLEKWQAFLKIGNSCGQIATCPYSEENKSAPSTRVLFSAESIGRQEIVLNLLATVNIHPQKIKKWAEFERQTDSPAAAAACFIIVSPIVQGAIFQDDHFMIITENDLLGERVTQVRYQKKSTIDPDAIIRNLTELKIGDPVVHIDHGVGRFLGLQTISVGDQTDEYLTLEYAGGDKLFVPIASLDLISRYSGGDVEHPPLHKLGSKQWETLKKKAAKKIFDVAAELLDIYAKRESYTGTVFDIPQEDYLLFSENFPFEETPDQKTAIDQIIQDMSTQKMMDRLICGDVGFGKTEVAMRAAFIAVANQKQVAILTPTTLLAQQHLESFQDRFANWPVQIDMLSRFRTQKEQKQTLEKLKTGQIDIIIGTHRLLQKDVQFKNLGLLIIDEEHRFGVRQKEMIKKMRAHVDILALTATPIPRTLNMAFSGIRDLSIIATPPKERLSIKTFVYEYNKTIIREAITREILRGGQVYFLHNRVETIERMAETLRELIPEGRIGIAHGQMHERQLEHVMGDFYRRKFNILVCSTIIESGIDIPAANTIIINNADRFGLAQLHQLRGRVGRSNRQAYAYLLVQSKKALGHDAKKRLDAVAAFEDLGTGFTLATHDLEIRGAGEILGKEQSGHIQAIGFNLYMELLDRAVQSLKSGKVVDLEKSIEVGIEINLSVCAIIPEDYLPDVHTRLILYKRIASAENNQELNDLQAEMIDRFGLLPEPVKNLFEIATLKLKLKKIGIKKIEASSERGFLEFTEQPNIDPSKIIQLIQDQPKQYQFDPATNRLKFVVNQENAQQRILLVGTLLERFT